MSNRSGAKGARAERLVADWFRVQGWPFADRRVKTGARDKGDISGLPAVVEVKDSVRYVDLAGWVDEAVAEARNASVAVGAVMHHRKGKGCPAEWYVTMTGEHFDRLLHLAAADLGGSPCSSTGSGTEA